MRISTHKKSFLFFKLKLVSWVTCCSIEFFLPNFDIFGMWVQVGVCGFRWGGGGYVDSGGFGGMWVQVGGGGVEVMSSVGGGEQRSKRWGGGRAQRNLFAI